jgi:hypothetical protein
MALSPSAKCAGMLSPGGAQAQPALAQCLEPQPVARHA